MLTYGVFTRLLMCGGSISKTYRSLKNENKDDCAKYPGHIVTVNGYEDDHDAMIFCESNPRKGYRPYLHMLIIFTG